MTLYNENDPAAASWLRELIATGRLERGEVRGCGIQELTAADCPERAHFFAGIGGWPLALSLAGFPADRPVWTGSCPCQPFSVAGSRKGTADERHLWPDWLRLIRECLPPTIFGEQVASRLGREWLAGVRVDLEALGYAVGAADLCAASVGAPHIRQRLFWVAHRIGAGLEGHSGDERNGDKPGWLAAESAGSIAAGGGADGLDHADAWRLEGSGQPEPGDVEGARRKLAHGSGYWEGRADVACSDGKTRRVEPGVCPLAHGVPGRVVKLHGYGNAIVPQVAAAFVKAYMEATA